MTLRLLTFLKENLLQNIHKTYNNAPGMTEHVHHMRAWTQMSQVRRCVWDTCGSQSNAKQLGAIPPRHAGVTLHSLLRLMQFGTFTNGCSKPHTIWAKLMQILSSQVMLRHMYAKPFFFWFPSARPARPLWGCQKSWLVFLNVRYLNSTILILWGAVNSMCVQLNYLH